MKRLFAIVFLASTAVAALAAPVDDYLASRDRAIAVLKTKGGASDATTEKRALGDLETQLRRLLAQLKVNGVPAHGKINLETLVEDQGFGRIDGLLYEPSTLDTHVLVTSDALLGAWLKAQTDVPKDLDPAIRADAFYYQAVGNDAAFAQFASLPVTAKDASKAVAFLVQQRQDIGPGVPDTLVGTVVRGDRIVVVRQHVVTRLSTIPACDSLRAAEQKKADAVLKIYNKGGSTDEKLFERYTALQDEGDAKSRLCFGEHVKDQPAYAAVLRQADALFDSLR